MHQFFLMCHLHFSYEAYDKLQISVAELPVDDVFKALKEEMKDFHSSYNTRHRGCSLSCWPVYVSVLSKVSAHQSTWALCALNSKCPSVLVRTETLCEVSFSLAVSVSPFSFTLVRNVCSNAVVSFHNPSAPILPESPDQRNIY